MDKTLNEIAKWAELGNSEVAIPSLQRGLVWKPQQVELLWDSLLRGFPVGAFLLSASSVKGEQSAQFYLMDGQQRFNAISLGFHTVPNPRAILWIDIDPSENKSTRRFWVKATTAAHPWGYHNDDSCTTLDAQEKRDAIELFFGEERKNIYNDVISLQGTWPFFANKPIPLHYFLDAKGVPEIVMQLCETNPDGYAYLQKNPLSDEDRSRIVVLCESFKKLLNYTIPCHEVPQEMIQQEGDDKEEGGNATALEVLFTRLNTGGTRISQDDLNYSAIKAYWPEIKSINDTIAERYMAPAKLVMLAFRYALSDGKKFPGNYSIAKIRSLAKEQDKRERILDLYTRLDSLLHAVDMRLNVYSQDNPYPDAIPAYIRNSICYSSPELFLLLMFLADNENNVSADARSLMLPLAIYVHLFGIGEGGKRELVNRIMEVASGNILTLESIQRSISDAIAKGWVFRPLSGDEFDSLFTIKASPSWSPWAEKGNEQWRDFYWRFFDWGKQEAREMLLLSERIYLNTHFRQYDPARQDLWENANRPWDYDHIVPQEWIGGKRGTYREYCKTWLGCIGNIAAIPFEINRGKSNLADYAEYEAFKKELLFDNSVKSLDLGITYNQDKAVRFASISFKRQCTLYKNLFDSISPLFEGMAFSPAITERKARFKAIADELSPMNVECFFAVYEDEFPCKGELDWARAWLSIGLKTDKYFIAATQYFDSPNIEIGIRKIPGETITEQTPNLPQGYELEHGNPWWYSCNEVPLAEWSDLRIAQELLKLYEAV